MEVISDLAKAPDIPDGSVVTIGAYDGVHLGHQALLEQVRGLAANRGAATSVVTFDRHPAIVVRPESAPKLLTDLEQKLELLASAGVDYTLVIHFDEERSKESAEDFVEEVLVGALKARAVVVGHDFHFGHARRGNVEMLAHLGAEFGFDVLGVTLFESKELGGVMSSTRIRGLLLDGEVAEAATLLGRPYEIRGTVARGDGRGGPELGFPTANVTVPSEILLPGDGIYAGWYELPDATVHAAAISVGRRPQFYEHADASLLEAHLLDFDGDLYGQRAKVRFVARLRGEARFESVDALIAQIGDDVEQTRRVLA